MEKAKTYAAIDIGSNAARLLIKRIDQNAAKRSGFKKLLLLRVPLRLGFDVFKAGKLSKKKMEQVVRLLKAYRQLMNALTGGTVCLLAMLGAVGMLWHGANKKKEYAR